MFPGRQTACRVQPAVCIVALGCVWSGGVSVIVKEGKRKGFSRCSEEGEWLRKEVPGPVGAATTPLPRRGPNLQDPGNSTGSAEHHGALAPDSAVRRWAHTTDQANPNPSHTWAPL